ncbi:MAG: hypothetical protein WC897_02630 [Candidatus Gracilibacteria bacterium]
MGHIEGGNEGHSGRHERPHVLVVRSSEARTNFSGGHAYNFVMPDAVFRTEDQNVVDAVCATARVAHGHNTPGVKPVVVNLPAGLRESLAWFLGGLEADGNQMIVKSRPDIDFADSGRLRSCGLSCVDRRLNNGGADLGTGTCPITYPGGGLALDPKLKGKIPPYHRVALLRGLREAKEAGWSLNTIDYHGAFGEAKGCGMRAFLAKSDESIGRDLSRPQQVVDMLKRGRDELGALNLCGTDCRLTFTGLTRRNDSTVYDFEDPGDLEHILSVQRLAL